MATIIVTTTNNHCAATIQLEKNDTFILNGIVMGNGTKFDANNFNFQFIVTKE